VKETCAATFATLLLLVHPVVRFTQDDQGPIPEEYRSAARHMSRLPPSSFKSAPKWVVEDLVARGCTIPQVPAFMLAPFAAQEPSNLIRGQFARNGEWDWAAICSRGGKSRAVVLWGGPPACPSDLREVEDAGQLESIGAGKFGYDFFVVRVTSDQIRKDMRDWGEPNAEEKSRTILHDGIEFPSGKGVAVWYCTLGQWTTPAAGD
jgi:hypothetical protein